MGEILDTATIDELIRQRLDELLPAKIEEKLRELEARKTSSLAIIATKGTLDWAYPPFILASTAAALGWDVSVFCTFYGLNLLKKSLSDIKISPLGNPGMPMKVPAGPNWFKSISWNIPNIIQSNMPGFEAIATRLMHTAIKKNGIASLEELRSASQESGVKLVACQMTVDLFGYRPDDFVAGVEFAGAATFLSVAQQARVCLFI